MNDMTTPIKFIENDICTNCNSRSIELYDYFNNSLNYSIMVKHNNFSAVDRKNVYVMKCKRCGKKYHIKWINNGTIPTPMRNEIDLEYFKSKFKINI